MALQISLTPEQTNQGVDAPEAYVRIVAIRADYLAGTIEVAVNGYASDAAAAAGKSPVWGNVYQTTVEVETPPGGVVIAPPSGGTGVGVPVQPTPPASTGRTDVYNWLKALPAFAGSVDV